MKKEDLKSFILGLVLGLLPIYPFLIICPRDFILSFFLRTDHIAYGFSIWHAIMIAWSGFTLYYVSGITDTYNDSNEPWFVSELYLYFFIALYVVIFIIYFIKNRQKIKTEELDQQSLLYQLNLVFIPLFIFALTFKAINIQVLAWFTPFIALLRKTDLLIEYSVLTFLNGLGLIIFESFDPTAFASFAAPIAAEGSIMNILVIKPVLYIQSVTTETVWVGLVFFTIIWYLLRTSIELIINTKEIVTINS